MARRVKTRDYSMLQIIMGATKAGIHRDNRKHASATACRGTNKPMIAQKKKIVHSFDWTRPALHGDELFEVCVDNDNKIVEVYLIDEEGDSVLFNMLSFSPEEMIAIQNAAHDDWEARHGTKH